MRSEIPLDGPVAHAGRCDAEIHRGERREIPDAIPPGRLLAHLHSPAGSSSLARSEAGVTLRIHRLCDVEIRGRRLRFHLPLDADEDLAGMFIDGALATLLVLEGCCVLHASAVEVDGRVVGFVGASGGGKSTIAALCCAVGARLVTDDTLRVECNGAGGWCFSGSTALRLRAGAAKLIDLLPPSCPRRSTADERVAVRPPAALSASSAKLPLAAIVVPECAPGSERLAVERLHGSDALLSLVRYPRSLGWIDSDFARRDFAVLAALADAVPVHRASLPWGPPFDPGLASTLLARIGVGSSDRRGPATAT